MTSALPNAGVSGSTDTESGGLQCQNGLSFPSCTHYFPSSRGLDKCSTGNYAEVQKKTFSHDTHCFADSNLRSLFHSRSLHETMKLFCM